MPAQLPLLRKLSLHFYSQVHEMTPNLDRCTVVMNKMYSCNLRVTLDNSFLLTKCVCFHRNFGFLWKNNIVWWLGIVTFEPPSGGRGGRMYMFPWSLNLFWFYPLFTINKTKYKVKKNSYTNTWQLCWSLRITVLEGSLFWSPYLQFACSVGHCFDCLFCQFSTQPFPPLIWIRSRYVSG